MDFCWSEGYNGPLLLQDCDQEMDSINSVYAIWSNLHYQEKNFAMIILVIVKLCLALYGPKSLYHPVQILFSEKQARI